MPSRGQRCAFGEHQLLYRLSLGPKGLAAPRVRRPRGACWRTSPAAPGPSARRLPCSPRTGAASRTDCSWSSREAGPKNCSGTHVSVTSAQRLLSVTQKQVQLASHPPPIFGSSPSMFATDWRMTTDLDERIDERIDDNPWCWVADVRLEPQNKTLVQLAGHPPPTIRPWGCPTRRVVPTEARTRAPPLARPRGSRAPSHPVRGTRFAARGLLRCVHS